MKIESIIPRKNGTRVTLDNTTYHFKPETAKGPHVADVENEDHIDILLDIPEGFRQFDKSNTASKPSEPKSSTGSTVLQGNDGGGEPGDQSGSSGNPPVTDKDDSGQVDSDRAVMALLANAVSKIKPEITKLTDDQLAAAIEFEGAAEKPRPSLVDLFKAEQKRRAEATE